MIFLLVLLVFIGAATMLTLENKEKFRLIKLELENRRTIEDYVDDPAFYEYYFERNAVYAYHDMIYYMVVTLTTLGYGDIYPVTV